MSQYATSQSNEYTIIIIRLLQTKIQDIVRLQEAVEKLVVIHNLSDQMCICPPMAKQQSVTQFSSFSLTDRRNDVDRVPSLSW